MPIGGGFDLTTFLALRYAYKVHVARIVSLGWPFPSLVFSDSELQTERFRASFCMFLHLIAGPARQVEAV